MSLVMVKAGRLSEFAVSSQTSRGVRGFPAASRYFGFPLGETFPLWPLVCAECLFAR